jgi:hypothetical protein
VSKVSLREALGEGAPGQGKATKRGGIGIADKVIDIDVEAATLDPLHLQEGPGLTVDGNRIVMPVGGGHTIRQVVLIEMTPENVVPFSRRHVGPGEEAKRSVSASDSGLEYDSRVSGRIRRDSIHPRDKYGGL